MGCPGGCIAGAGTCLPVDKAQAAVRKTVDATEKKLPEKDLFEIELP